MKQRENNEIDNLLHVWAGRRRSVSAELAGNNASVHLDADELNSYAEGALPNATRARYTSHLADCDDCRKMVTQLSLAAGLVLNEPTGAKQDAPAGWRRTLTAFFAPSVLRYSLPALILVFVGVVFFASRRATENASIARQSQLESKPAAEGFAKEQTGEASGIALDSPTEQEKTAQLRVAQPQPARAPATAAKAGEKDQQTAAATAPTPGVASREQEATRKETAADSEKKKPDAAAPGTYASEPAPPAAKPASSDAPKDARLAELRDANARKRESEGAGVATAGATMSGKDDDRQKAKTLSGARANEARRMEGRLDKESEARSVGGRRFQRRNDVWVDAAYNSSMSTISVKRDSEQYRALIADEPEIDTIAKQLSGEVLLVWKGRAYRIK